MKYLLAVAFSAIVSAAPTAPPAKFAIQISTTVGGNPTTAFLKKNVNSDITRDIKEAAACSLADGKLTCEGKLIGVPLTRGLGADMSTFEAVNPKTQSNSIYTGFSLNENNELHWKNDEKFSKVMGWDGMVKAPQTFPDHEARFALFGSGSATKFYANLGCTNPIHLAFHGDLHMGPVKAIAL